MLEKYRDGTVPPSPRLTSLDELADKSVEEYGRAMDALDLRAGAEATWAIVSGANLYVQQAAPWSLAKAGKDEELDQVLSALARALCRLAILSAPFMPSKAQALWQDLGLDGNVADAPWELVGRPQMEGRRTKKGAALFPKPAAV